MQMIKRSKHNGCNQYEIRDSDDVYVGWLSREYRPWILFTGHREPAYEWQLDVHIDYYRWDDTEWESFKEAKAWLMENVQ